MYEVTKEEIEQIKNPKEHITWVYSTFDKFTSQEDIVFARNRSTPELKVLFEESYPLSKLCEYYFNDDVMLKQVVGNQSYDVEVSNCDEVEYVEITNAINGYSDKLRLIKLNEDGHVSASDSVGIRRINGITEIEVGYEISDDMQLVEEKSLIELIETAVNKKIEIGYPDKTLLLIAFDNAIQNSVGTDMSDLDTYMKEVITPLIQGHFFKAVLIGLAGEHHFETEY